MLKKVQANPLESQREWPSKLPLLRKLFVMSGVGLAVIGAAHAANPATSTTSTGQPLNIEITAPNDGAQVISGESLAVEGVASIGALPTEQASVVYMVDVSGSTGFVTGLDCNDDGFVNADDDFTTVDVGVGSTLDCEIGGIIALNESLQSNSQVSVAVVAFGTSAAVIQPFTSPPDTDANGNSIPDVNEVLSTLDQGGAVGGPSVGGLTNFGAAIQATIDAFSTRPDDEQKVAYLVTDGQDDSGVSEAELAAAAGIRIETLGIGAGAQSCGSPGSSLEAIALATGGSCTNVTDITQLIAEINSGTGLAPAGIDRVEISLNGNGATDVAVNVLGRWDGLFPADAVIDGANVISARVFADDGTVATAEIVVNATPRTNPDPVTQICNDLIDMQVIQSSITIDPTPTACGPLGTLTFTADLTNISGNPIDDLFLEVTELSNGNQLCNADGGPGTVGDTYTIGDVAAVPAVQQFPFEIGLASSSQFTFFVDAYCDLPPLVTSN